MWISKQTSVSIDVFVFFFTLKRSTYHKIKRSNDTTSCNKAIVDISQPCKRQVVMFSPCDSQNVLLETPIPRLSTEGVLSTLLSVLSMSWYLFTGALLDVRTHDASHWMLDQTRLHPLTTRSFQRRCVSHQMPQNFMQMRSWHRYATRMHCTAVHKDNEWEALKPQIPKPQWCVVEIKMKAMFEEGFWSKPWCVHVIT